MSSQSILHRDNELLFFEFDDKLVWAADRVFIKDKFLVGDGVHPDEVDYILTMHKVLCNDNCEIVDYINESIVKKTECDNKTISKNIEEYKKQCETSCSDTEAVAACCNNIITAKW